MAAVIAFALFAAWECLLRSRGLLPDFDYDDQQMWAAQRARVGRDGGKQLVFIGSSRMLAGLHGETLNEMVTDRGWVQLALDDSTPAPVLRDLLADESFSGVIVCDLYFGIDGEARDAQVYVDFFHESWNWAQALDFAVNREVSGRFAARASRNSLVRYLSRELVEALYHPPGSGGEPHKSVIRSTAPVRFDRTNNFDFSLPYYGFLVENEVPMFRDQAKAFYADPTPERDGSRTYFDRIRELEPAIAAFEQRGGKIAFVRLPSTLNGYPSYAADMRRDSWDAWATMTHATTIHYLDVAGMRDLQTPDASHVDKADAPKLTRALVEELRRRAVLSIGRP